jgi:uncharacterized membrane protein YdjX (TVP38/TMEM64 family)
MKTSRRVWIVAAAIVATLLVLGLVLPVRDWSDSFEDAIERMDLGAGLLTFGLVYAVATLLLIPGWIFPIAAGALFGAMWGMLVTLAATAASALAGFIATRYVLRDHAAHLAGRHRMFRAFDQAVGKEGWRVVALLRLSPLLSFGMKSYFFGLTRVPLGAYIAGTMAGMLPGLALKVYVGSAGRDVLHGGGAAQWALLATGLAATVAATVVVTRLTRKRLQHANATHSR